MSLSRHRAYAVLKSIQAEKGSDMQVAIIGAPKNVEERIAKELQLGNEYQAGIDARLEEMRKQRSNEEEVGHKVHETLQDMINYDPRRELEKELYMFGPSTRPKIKGPKSVTVTKRRKANKVAKKQRNRK